MRRNIWTTGNPPLPMTSIVLRYNKGVFLPPLILLIAGMVFLNLFVSISLGFDGLSMAMAAAVSGILVLVIGISPIMTDHALTENELVLRQGWYFHSIIPVDEIGSVNVLERGPRRTGVFFDFRGKSLYVTTQRSNLIKITLKQQRRFNWALGKRTDQVIFDSLDQMAFLKAMGTKAEITLASQAR